MKNFISDTFRRVLAALITLALGVSVAYAQTGIPNSSLIVLGIVDAASGTHSYSVGARVDVSSVPSDPAITGLTLTPANGTAITGGLTPNGYWRAQQNFGSTQPTVSASAPLNYTARATYADGTSATQTYSVTHFNNAVPTGASIASGQNILTTDLPALTWTNAPGNHSYHVTAWSDPSSIYYWKSDNLIGGPVSIPASALIGDRRYRLAVYSEEPSTGDGIGYWAGLSIPVCYQCTVLRVRPASVGIPQFGRFLNEGGSESFLTTLFKPDATTQAVSPSWSLIGAPAGVSIDSTGLLTTGAVSANQSFSVQASFSDATLTGGVTLQSPPFPVIVQKGQDHWSGSGQPGQGGTVLGWVVTGAATGQPTSIVAAMYGAGLYRTVDGGSTWARTGSGLANFRLRALTLIPSTSTMLVQADGFGLYRSTNWGATWTPANVGLSGCEYVRTIRALSSSLIYAGTNACGIFKSTDAGLSWTPVNNAPFTAGAGLPISAILNTESTGQNLLVATAGGQGIYKSTDGGQNWSAAGNGLSATHQTANGVIVQTLASFSSNAYFLAVAEGTGLFKSTDGVNWSPSNNGLPGLNLNPGISLWPIGGVSQLLVSVDGYGLYKSTDQGANWQPFTGTGLPGNVRVGTPFVAASNGWMYASSGAGWYRSTDGGATWHTANNGLGGGYVISSASDPSDSNIVMATADTVYKSTDGGATWAKSGAGINAAMTAWRGSGGRIIAVDSSTWYVTTGNGGVYKSTDAGANWSPVNSGLPPAVGMGGRLVKHPGNPQTLYWLPYFTGLGASPYGVYVTSNGGASWSAINGDLPAAALYANWLAVDPANGNLYLATDAGLYRSANGGTNWTQVSALEAGGVRVDSGTTPSTVYWSQFASAGDRADKGGAASGLYRSADNFATTQQLLSNVPVAATALVRNGAALELYVGAWSVPAYTGGVLRSRDGGASWQQINAGLNTSWYVRSFEVNAAGTQLLRASTYGGGLLNFVADATPAPTAVTLNLVAGWNLMGNGGSAAIDVATMFGDATKVKTVWKWVPSKSNWAFYTPLQTDSGASYAAGKGYDFLSVINGGEGFWVNANSAMAPQLPAGTAISSPSFQGMSPGWNLIAVGDNRTPSEFNKQLSVTPPAVGDIPLNVTTLWAWDSALSNWYFYAPSLEKNGTLTNYIQSKNYLDFGTKALDPTMGFWVNKP